MSTLQEKVPCMNIAPENRVSQKESLPTMHFQGRCVSFSERVMNSTFCIREKVAKTLRGRLSNVTCLHFWGAGVGGKDAFPKKGITMAFLQGEKDALRNFRLISMFRHIYCR